PDVHHLLAVPRHRYSPGLARAAEAEVPQAAFDEAPRFVVAVLRLHEVGPLVVNPEQLFLKGRQAEEPVALLDPLGGDAMLGAQPVGGELVLGLELLAADAIQACVRVLVDVALVVDPLDEFLDEAVMSLIGGANEE